MPSTAYGLLSHLRVMVAAWRNDPRSDAELLARYAENRDEAAFTALAGRHGEHVWRTCCRVFGDSPDAEDVFQNVFLTLTQKADRLAANKLAGWLHQVAFQTALKSRSQSSRHCHLEEASAVAKASSVAEGAEHRELQMALEAQLAQLPERHRDPLILRYLDGKTLAEIAQIHGVSVQAVAKRISRGEVELRRRLEKQGFTMNEGSLAILLGPANQGPALPSHLVGRTVETALAFRKGALVTRSADLAKQVLQSSPSHGGWRLKAWLALALGFGSIGAGTCFVAWRMGFSSGDQPATSPVAQYREPQGWDHGKAASVQADFHGDPLPPGAVARIGTVRFRQNPPAFADITKAVGGCQATGGAFLPDARTFVTIDEHGVSFREVAGHLFHTGLVGIGRDAGAMNAPCCQLHDEQQIERRQTLFSPDFSGREIYGRQNLPMGLEKRRPRRLPLPLRSRADAVPLQNVANRPIRDLVAEIGQRSLDTAFDDGFLRQKRYVLMDRDAKFSASFRQILTDSGATPVLLPPRSPNLNSHLERFWRSLQEECLDRLVFFGEDMLRRTISQYVDHYHGERNHQGLGNGLIDVGPEVGVAAGLLQCRERLGGVLRYYYRQAV